MWTLLRRPILIALLAILALPPRPSLAAPLTSVGFQRLSIPDPQGPPIEAGVWYPADRPENVQPLGLDQQSVAADAPPTGARRGLIVMSHGNGGWFASHSDTAVALAKAGFVAAALTHTGDNYRDQSRAIDMANRPRQLKRLTDYMLATWSGRGVIDPHRIGAFGFSSGGFTVLVAAGGEPDLSRMGDHCRDHPSFFDCKLVGAHAAAAFPAQAWTHDGRIQAVVSAAPALGFAFSREGLMGVAASLQLWRASEDHVLPHPFYAEAVRAALPTQPDYRVAQGADHFDFLPPCSDRAKAVMGLLCASPPGFDRAAFHAEFNKAVVDFFRRRLGE